MFDTALNSFPVGSLLFKGVRGIDQVYESASSSDELYVDLQYVLGYRILVKPDGTVVALKRKNVVPDTPVYPSGDLMGLFRPE